MGAMVWDFEIRRSDQPSQAAEQLEREERALQTTAGTREDEQRQRLTRRERRTAPYLTRPCFMGLGHNISVEEGVYIRHAPHVSTPGKVYGQSEQSSILRVERVYIGKVRCMEAVESIA